MAKSERAVPHLSRSAAVEEDSTGRLRLFATALLGMRRAPMQKSSALGH